MPGIVKSVINKSKFKGSTANAAAAGVAKDVKEWVEARSGLTGTMYPTFAAWFRDRLADHWEVMSFNSELADYGTADWKGRALEAAFWSRGKRRGE